MSPNLSFPKSFVLVKTGKTSLLLRKDYQDLLLRQGIEDIDSYMKRSRQISTYLKGRKLHLSIPIRDKERMVLRQYHHGGLLRLFTGSFYLFGSRSFRELALTEEIRSCGIPTIQPIGAIHRPLLGPLHQSYLLTLEVSNSKDSIQYLQEIGPHPFGGKLIQKRKMIQSAGLILQKFHREGFFHGDLQLKNILVVGDQPLLIDFDRSYRKRSLSIRERMRNLLRLNRSVEKWRHNGLPITRTDCWRFFLAYGGEDLAIRKAMKWIMRTYSIRFFLYRCVWTLENIVQS